MASNAGNRGYAHQAFSSTGKGNTYVPYNQMIGDNANGGAWETTGGSMQVDDKWTRFFGAPPYTTWQHDNYSSLGHENYQLPTAYIGRLVCICLVALGLSSSSCFPQQHSDFNCSCSFHRNLHIEKLLNVSVASQDDFYTRVS